MNQMHERLIFWTLNGEKQAPISCSEGDTEELFRGLLFSRNLISSPVDCMEFEEENETIHIRLKGINTAGDGEIPAIVDNPFRIEYAKIRQLDQIMSGKREFGNHQAAVVYNDQSIERQDIGRHNAIDKVVAAAIMNEFNPAHSVLCMSGRVSLEILNKAAHAGFPVIFTLKFPSDLAAEAAQKYGMMIVSYFKGQVEYSGKNRWAD